MLTKRFISAPWRNDGMTSHLLDVFSRGVDPAQFRKIARTDPPETLEIVPEKGFSHLLLITTGAGEFFGPNNNADFFNEKEARVEFSEPKGAAYEDLQGGLKDFHATYRKFGGVYREHANGRKGHQKEGSVVWERVNPDMHWGEVVVRLPDDKWGDELQKVARGEPVFWSMGAGVPYDICFEGLTDIETQEGLVAISQVKLGQFVRTHTGKLRRVTEVFKREYSGRVCKVRIGTWPEATAVTPNHPYLVLRDKELRRCWGSANGRKIRCSLRPNATVCWRCGKPVTQPVWAPAEALVPGDFVLTPLPIADRSELVFATPVEDMARARLLGLYLGDGHIVWQRSGRKKRGIAKDMGVGWTVGGDNPDLCSDIQNLGKLAGLENLIRKHVCHAPHWRLSVYDQSFSAWVQDMVGRGSRQKYLSEALLSQTEEFLLAVLGGYTDADGCVDHTKGQIRWNTSSKQLAYTMRTLLGILGIPFGIHNEMSRSTFSEKPTKMWVVCSGKAALQKLRGYSQKVGDYETEGWTSSGNSFIFGDYLASRVVHTESEEKESLSVYNLGVEEDESYVANGAVVHNCSICGNHAHKRAEYCGHMRNHKLELTKEGHQVFVYNDQPHFHDISCVRVPADRIAFTLAKVASGRSLLNDEEDPMMWVPLRLAQKLASFRERDRLDLLQKLAELEKKLQGCAIAGGSDLHDAFELSDDEEEDVAKKLKDAPVDQLMSGLLARNMMLPPRSFTMIVLKKNPDKLEGSTNLPGALSSVFQDILGGDLSSILDDSSYVPGIRPAGLSLGDKLEGLKPLLSLDEKPTQMRIVKITISKAPKQHEKKASDQEPSEVDRIVAREYAKYQLAFLAQSKEPGNETLAVACKG